MTIESPLNEPTISDLFALPPSEHTDAHIEAMILHFREERHMWNKAEKEQPKRRAPKEKISSVSLDDLGL